MLAGAMPANIVFVELHTLAQEIEKYQEKQKT